jgi:hypothetical protein
MRFQNTYQPCFRPSHNSHFEVCEFPFYPDGSFNVILFIRLNIGEKLKDTLTKRVLF